MQRGSLIGRLGLAVVLVWLGIPMPAQKIPDLQLDRGLRPASPGQAAEIAVAGASVYAVWQDSRNFRKDVYFNRSVDGGATWLAADVRLDSDAPGPGDSSNPKIAASGSSVFVVWEDQRNGRQDIYFNRSLDGGATWLPGDLRIDTDVAGAASSVEPRIAASGASVYLTWVDSRSGNRDIYCNRSLDGGATWLAADVRVDTDPLPGDSANARIAASGAAVYVVWDDGRSGSRDIYFNRSSDGGATWFATDVRLDTAPVGAGAGRPNIAVSGSDVYVAWDDFRIGEDAHFNRSLDGGVTWLAADVRLNSGGRANYQQLAVSGSSVFVTWYSQRGGGEDIYFTRSLDRGTTWLAAEVRLDTDAPSAARSLFPRIAAAGSDVYVAWEDSRAGSRDVHVNRSLDSGTTWLASDVRLDTTVAGSSNSTGVRLAVSASSIYVTWTDSRFNADVYLNYSSDSGATWLAEDYDLRADDPQIPSAGGVDLAATGDAVYAAWSDARSGRSQLYFNRSTNRGSTWLEDDVRIDTSSVVFRTISNARIATSGSAVYVVWEDTRNSNVSDIYFTRSLDGGATWLASDVRLDTDAPAAARSLEPQIAVAGDSVYVAWKDFRNGNRTDAYFNRSLDNGTTWLASDVRLDTDGLGAASSEKVAISAWGTAVYVVWRDSRSGAGEIHFNRSADSGTTWLATDLRLNTDAQGSGFSDAPQITAWGSSVYATWEDYRNGARDVYFSRSLDAGASWLAVDVRLDTDAPGVGDSSLAQVVASGSSVCVAWEDSRNGSRDLYLNRSLDNGTTWLAADVRLDTDSAGAADSIGVRLAASGTAVYATWADSRNGNYDIYYRRSPDNGTTWTPTDVRLDADAGAAASFAPRIAASGGFAYVAWGDNRDGGGSIYFNIPFGMQPYGAGLAGSGGIVPDLSGSGTSTYGNAITLNIADGLGAAPSATLIGVGAGTKLSFPFFGGTLLVLPTTSRSLGLGGATDVPGAGTGSFWLFVPDNPAFVGLNLNFQTWILDAGAVQGISMTNGVEVWIG